MKFAFSTVSCPKWDFQTVIDRAKEYGYDGVEIRGFLNESILTATNVFLSEPAKIKRLFAAGGIEIACLSSSVRFTQSRKQNRQMLEDLRTYIDTAQQIGCPLVKIFDMQVKPGQSREGAEMALAGWLAEPADYAAEHGVTIVIENALSFRSAKEMWMILEGISHPSVGVCWDVFSAAQIGESPAISVPTLNSRIHYTHVKDATLGPLGASYCQLGEGDVPVQKFLIRLMGIGYGGYVTMEWEKAWLANLAEPEEILPGAVKKLREWTKPPEVEAPKKKEPAKVAGH